MKTPAYLLNLAILFALQIPSSGAQLAHVFATDAWVGYAGAALLSPLYPVGCVVAWFGAVDRWGLNPIFAGALYLALFMATVLATLVMRGANRMQGVATLDFDTDENLSTTTDTNDKDRG